MSIDKNGNITNYDEGVSNVISWLDAKKQECYSIIPISDIMDGATKGRLHKALKGYGVHSPEYWNNKKVFSEEAWADYSSVKALNDASAEKALAELSMDLSDILKEAYERKMK
ncbi:MAG: hypothetical protein K6E13_03350 [Lachnospiraceae bacterium]|nr:hypothetical protein [Lachnospiraceae bacterium]